MTDSPDPKTNTEADEKTRKQSGVEHPGKMPGEGSAPAEAGTEGAHDDDSAATGSGPSGGAPEDTSATTTNGNGEAVGDGPSGGAE